MFDHTTITRLQAERQRQLAARTSGRTWTEILRSLRDRRDRPEVDPVPSSGFGVPDLRPH